MCQVSHTKRKIAVGFYPPEKAKNQGGYDLKTTEQEKKVRAGCGKAINHCQTELNNQFNCLEVVAVQFSWLMSRFDKLFFSKKQCRGQIKPSTQYHISHLCHIGTVLSCVKS